MKRHFLAFAALAAVWSSTASANDGAAERAAGGLVFVQNDQVDMVSEELFVSLRQVRVRYVFRNRTPQDVRLTVAFPMPDWDLSEPVEGDVVWPSGFETMVDGRPVRAEVELRALVNGTDRTALLRELGIPIRSHLDPAADSGTGIDGLPLDARRRLAAAGLIRSADEPDPLWTVKETWHWDQLFPAGRDLVVEHRYAPGAGGTVFSALAMPDWRQSESGRAWMARFCVEPEFVAAIDRISRRQGVEYAQMPENWVSYILTTGAGWRSPIADFRLVVDKGSSDALVSFCGEGVRRISPTQFEMRRRDWRPDRNLEILFLRP